MKRKALFAIGLGIVAGLVACPSTSQAQVPAPFQAPGSAEAPEVDFGINRDVLVTPAQGPFMICLTSYQGKEAPRMARQLVTLLRQSRHNLPAYVFNYGIEEQQKEKARQDALKQQHEEWINRMKAEFGDNVAVGKFAVAKRQVNVQVAVLIGGYADMDSARRALDALRARRLTPQDFEGVQLDSLVSLDPGDDHKVREQTSVNPFRTAFVVRNPSLPAEKVADADKLDLPALRRLNSEESYSLLACKKPVTLVVAQYFLPAPLQQPSKGNHVLAKVGLGKSEPRDDPAAKPAHCLAEWFRKGNIESYVLHTKHYSLVTVGSFDSPQDPRLKLMQDRMAGLSKDQRYQMLNLFAQPMPMQVPR